VTACPMELNLRPAKVARRHELAKRRPFFIAAAACFILALLGWSAYYARAAQLTRHSTEQLQQKIDVMRAAEAQLDKLRKQTTSLDSVAAPLVAAVDSRSFWPEILEDLNSRLPKEGIWITELVATSGGKPIGVQESRVAALAASPTPAATAARGKTTAPTITGPAIDGILVRGLYLFNPKQQEVVVDFFRNLVGSPFFSVDPNNQARTMKATIPNNKEWAFDYELHLDLRKPVPLP
jgi:Tfp pilus assembly protein PilN